MTKRRKKKNMAIVLSEQTGKTFKALQEETGKVFAENTNPSSAMQKRLAKNRKKVGDNVYAFVKKKLHS